MLRTITLLFVTLICSGAAAQCPDQPPLPDVPNPACTPLAVYPRLCVEQIPYPADSAGKKFYEPELPRNATTQVVATTEDAFCQQMKLGSRTITVPASTTLSTVACGGHDVEVIVLGAIRLLYLSTDYPKQGAAKFSTRVRVRGPGRIGAVVVLKTTGTGAGHVTDIVIDGVKFTPGSLGVANSSEPIINTNDDVWKFAVVNSVARTGVSSSGGGSFMIAGGADILVAGCNIDVDDSSGPGNNWAVRLGSNKIDGSAARYILVDNHFDSGGEQAIFRQGGNGTGTTQRIDHTALLRNAFVSPSTPLLIKDENCGTTDETYGDQNTFVFSGAALGTTNFAAHNSSCALSRKWIITNTSWRTTDSSYVNDAVLKQFMAQCPAGTTCQYLQGNRYQVDPNIRNLAVPWAEIRSPLVGLVGSDPALLP